MNKHKIIFIVFLCVMILPSCQAVEEYEWGTSLNDNGLVITPEVAMLMSDHETFDISPGYKLSIITLHVENRSMEVREISDQFYESFYLAVAGERHPSKMYVEGFKMMSFDDVYFGDLVPNDTIVTNLYFFPTEGEYTLVYDNKKKTSWQVVISH